MINEKKICVVIPAYNEEKQIEKVIRSMPGFVDRIVVVNDNSVDNTAEIVKKYIESDSTVRINIPVVSLDIESTGFNEADIILAQTVKNEMVYFTPSEIFNNDQDNDRIILINNLKNGGVGSSIARGYKWSKDHSMDCTAVMAGDGQMDPSELYSICEPIVNGTADYVKGNRLMHKSAWIVIPRIRYFGNSLLSILTKIASGYWKISDTQCGYTAISGKALQSIKLYNIYKRYGMPNDILVKLNIAYCKVKEVEIKPVYGVGEMSKMNIFKVVPKISILLLKSFLQRLWVKYLFRDFHPLFLLYHLSLILALADVPYIIKVIKAFIYGTTLNFEPLFAFLFLSISSFQSLLFAMWMDIQDNDHLYR